MERDTFLSSRRSSQGKDGRSGFSVEILQIPMSRQISRKGRGDMTSIPERF
jgi:hypothetical protein